MKSKSLYLKWILTLLPAIIGLIMYFILPYFPSFTEYVITRGLFKIVSIPYGWIMSLFPFSVTEIIVLLSPFAILTLIIIWIIRLIKNKNKLQTAEKGFRFFAFCLSMALFIFMVMDGANFSRIPLGDLFEMPNKQYTKEDLYVVTSDLAKKASAAREKLSEDENGHIKLSMSLSELLSKSDDCFHNLKKEYPYLSTGVWKVKSVALSHQWSYTGYTGVYCPWLCEASINTDVPDSELGHTATHEIAHTIGFAKENECNFLAWLACRESGIPDFEYSGHLAAFIYCSNALHKADVDLWRQAYSNCSQGILDDLRQRNEYWDSFKGEVMESSQQVNDTFIKVNGVESGVFSYDEMVEFMLRYYDKEDLI